MTPRVTIITACYNAIAYLPETAATVQAQTFEDWEWLLCDDGSKDGTFEWLREASQRDARLRVLPGVHAGKSAAVNRALGRIGGEYVALVDADDLWHSRKLEQQVAFLDAHPEVDITYSWAEEFWTPESFAAGPPPVVWPRIHTPRDPLAYLLSVGQFACNSSLLMRRRVFEELGGLNERIPIHDDYDLMLRAARRFRFRRTPGTLVRYRISPTARSARRTPEKAQAFHREMLRQDYSAVPAWKNYLGNYHIKMAEFALEGTLAESPRRHILASLRHNPREFRRWPLLLLTLLPGEWMLRAYTGLKRVQARLAPRPISAHRMVDRPKSR